MDNVGIAIILLWITLALTIAYGWVMNIITLINGGYEATSTMIVGFIGVVAAPVGALVYYIAG